MASHDYPMDISKRFPLADRPKWQWKATGAVTGRIIDLNSGDLTVEAAYRTIVGARMDVYRCLAFCDILDQATQANTTALTQIGKRAAQLHAATVKLQHSIDSTAATVGELGLKLDALIEIAGGVIVPEWLTTDEVENGDDMGVARKSAADLGLTVEYLAQWTPDYGVRDVLWTNPAAGDIVKRGSTVQVKLSEL